MEWYVYVLIASAAIILLQVLISFIFGDVDIDTDLDFEVSDIFSFKGALHFILGMSLVLTIQDEITFASVGVGLITGILFAFILGWFYGKAQKVLSHTLEYEQVLENREAEVYYWDFDSQTGQVFIQLEGRKTLVDLSAPKGEELKLSAGQQIKVSGSRNAVIKV